MRYCLVMAVVIMCLVAGCATDEPPAARPGHIPVLLYHSLGETASPSGTRIAVSEFTWQMDLLVAEGFEAVTVACVTAFLAGEGDLPQRPVLITFDDGYRSVYEYAFPVLDRLGLTTAQFIIVGGRPGEDLDWLHHEASGHMSWDELAEMVASGVAEVHSHTYGLHRLLPVGEEGEPGNPLTGRLWVDGVVESEDDYRSRVLDDLTRARSTIGDRLGVDAPALAFPWGQYTDEVIDIALLAGHTLMFTTRDGVIMPGSDPARLPRRSVYPDMTPEEFLALLAPDPD